MWFSSAKYLNVVICVGVMFVVTLTINGWNSSVDFGIDAASDRVETVEFTNTEAVNEVRNIKIYKNLDIYSNVVGFTAFLENSLQRKVLEYTLNPLKNEGDNYSSILLALEVKLVDRNDSNQVDTLQLVCKIISSQMALNNSLTKFTKEIYFYSSIVQVIEYFEEMEKIPQIERINAFPRYFGSRLSLNSSATKPDKDVVLLLENLVHSNYVNGNQRIGFDRNEIMAILKKLAKMHALGISMRRKQPDIFYSKISPFLQKRPSKLQASQLKFIIAELPIVFTNYSEKLHTAIKDLHQPSKEFLLETDPAEHTPFTTIYHNDLWDANVMFQKDNNVVDSAIQAKILDFQTYGYASFAHDMIFFIIRCARFDELRTNLKPFIEYYHLEFTKTLKHVNIPLDEYTYDKMWVEIKKTAKLQLLRTLWNIKIQLEFMDSSISKHGNELKDYLIEKPATDIVLIRWRCIIDLFIENEFI